MSRKKKKPIETAVVEPPVEETNPPPSKSNRKLFLLVGAVILVLAVAGILIYQRKFTARSGTQTTVQEKQEETPEALLQRLTTSNFEGMEKQVLEKIRKLAQEVQDNPTSAYSWGRLGINLDVHDLKKESLVCYEKAATLNSQDFRWPYYKGIVLAGMGSADSIPYLEKATTLKPSYAPAWVRAGQALLDAKRPDEATQKFRTAIELEPSSHAYLGLARVQLSKGNAEESLATLLEAVKLNPKHGEAHGLLSEVYRRLNRQQESQRELWISQQLPERTPLPDQQMGDWANEGVSSYWYDVRGRAYLQNGEYEAAVKELTMAANATTDARVFDTLGIAYQYLRRFDEAEQYHLKAIQMQPKSGSMLNNLASVYFEKKNLPKAFETMEKAIQAEPNFAYSYHHLGQMYLRVRNRKAAMEVYRLGTSRLPQNPQLSTQLAWMLATSADPSLRNGKEAVRLAESAAAKMSSPDPQTLIALAAAYAEDGDFDLAVKAASAARQLLGNNTGPLVQRVESFIALYKQKKPYREEPRPAPKGP